MQWSLLIREQVLDDGRDSSGEENP